jgi:hypothetical protein
MRLLLPAIAAALLCISPAPHAQGTDMKIRLIINGKTVSATLVDNPTSRDFLSLLPLTVTLEDYAAAEKITYLPRKLSTAGSPSGSDPSVGSLAYYAPWGNVALFYKDAPYAGGLIHLGRIDAGLETLSTPGALQARIETAD